MPVRTRESAVTFYEFAMVADGHRMAATGEGADCDALSDQAAHWFLCAVSEGAKDIVVSCTEHRHAHDAQCAAVSDVYSADMTECYRWAHDRAYYGI